MAPTGGAAVSLHHLIAFGRHQRGLAGLVHAAEPAGVEKRLTRLLFIDVIILPNLHRVSTARARIAVAGYDDALLSNPLPFQIAPPLCRPPLLSLLIVSYYIFPQRQKDRVMAGKVVSSAMLVRLYTSFVFAMSLYRHCRIA